MGKHHWLVVMYKKKWKDLGVPTDQQVLCCA